MDWRAWMSGGATQNPVRQIEKIWAKTGNRDLIVRSVLQSGGEFGGRLSMTTCQLP